MKKIGIIICGRYKDCGGGKCLRSMQEHVGGFAIYPKDVALQLVGYSYCGDCPGVAIVTRLIQLSLWNAPLNEKPTAIHIGPCIIDHCPYAETIIKKIRAKAGIPVYEGTHPYKPEDIFAS